MCPSKMKHSDARTKTNTRAHTRTYSNELSRVQRPEKKGSRRSRQKRNTQRKRGKRLKKKNTQDTNQVSAFVPFYFFPGTHFKERRLCTSKNKYPADWRNEPSLSETFFHSRRFLFLFLPSSLRAGVFPSETNEPHVRSRTTKTKPKLPTQAEMAVRERKKKST